MLRGPILAWSSLSRTAASSASGVGVGAGAPLSFAGLCVSLAGLCADRAVAVPPPEPITPPSISRSQSRRSRSADFDSASPWWTRMINQPFRARPRSPRLPQFQHIQRSRRRKQAHFRRALLAGSGLPGGRDDWQQAHSIIFMLESNRGMPHGSGKPARRREDRQDFLGQPHRPGPARRTRRRTNPGVRGCAGPRVVLEWAWTKPHLDLMITMTIPLDRSED